MPLQKLVRALFLASLASLIASLWLSESLPEPGAVKEELLSEPVQRTREAAPFDVHVGGIEYKVKPRYTYDLYGVVVSRHDAAVWWDYIHKEWNDKLNVVDLCVVWGDNLTRDAYRSVSYSHDQWTCWYSTSLSEVMAGFDTTAISNNHMITDDPKMAAALRAARVGDQIHFRGYLADYGVVRNGAVGAWRVSSAVRNDTGNGACEVVYVEAFEILKEGGGIWRKLKWLFAGLLGFSVIAWFLLPAKVWRKSNVGRVLN